MAILDRQFEVDAPDLAWVTDITYVWTDEGWLYLAAILDLSRHSINDLVAVAGALNSRPRKTLGWRTPAEVLNDHLLSLCQ
jgi:transposase InsO family protein